MSTKLTSTGLLYPDGTIIENSKASTRVKFGLGYEGGVGSTKTNDVNQLGIVATDVSLAGASGRGDVVGVSYGGDHGLIGFGKTSGGTYYDTCEHFDSNGIHIYNTTRLANGRALQSGAGYGGDKAIIGFGVNNSGSVINTTTLVSNQGVLSSDNSGIGTARTELAAVSYGGDKAMFAFGWWGTSAPGTYYSTINLVSNAGVLASDTASVATARSSLAGTSYGADKGIFAYGYNFASGQFNTINLVSNAGVIASDTSGVGTARSKLAAAGYGGDKGIFGYGYNGSLTTNITNKVSNAGIVAADTTGVGTIREALGACSYGG